MRKWCIIGILTGLLACAGCERNWLGGYDIKTNRQHEAYCVIHITPTMDIYKPCKEVKHDQEI